MAITRIPAGRKLKTLVRNKGLSTFEREQTSRALAIGVSIPVVTPSEDAAREDRIRENEGLLEKRMVQEATDHAAAMSLRERRIEEERRMDRIALQDVSIAEGRKTIQ